LDCRLARIWQLSLTSAFISAMRFAILGPIELSVEGSPVPLGGLKQRALLAFLLLHANQVVSRDRLIDALWGETPPPSASESLDAYIYRLRKLIGRDRLTRRGSGYVLAVEAGQLDADRFELLVAGARRASDIGDGRGAVGMLTEALALWRGPALADVLYQPFAGAPARQLEEQRLSALESRTEAELGSGGGAALVPELEHLVAGHPLRERLVAALMLALYRAGRHADALAAFQAARGRLIEELGLEPGPELRELQQRILQHDPALAAPRRAARLRRPAPRAASLAAAAALVLGAVLTGAFVHRSAAAPARPALPVGANGVVAVNPGSGRLVTAARLTGAPAALGSGAGSVWVADPGGGEVSRIQPGSGVAVDRILVGGEPGSVVSGGGAIWVASTVAATVTRIDPATEGVTQTITLPGSHLAAVAFGSGRLWVADSVARELFEIDPASGSLAHTLPLDLQPSALAVADGAIWVAGYDDATVDKIDPASGQVTGRVHVGDGPAALAFADGSLWVANSLDATVSRIDPATLTAGLPIPVGSGPAALAVGAGSVWVANQYSGTVSRIDPRRDRVAASVAVGGAPTSLTMGRGRLWAGVAADSGSHRGGTLVIVTSQTFVASSRTTLSSVDPAFYNVANNPQFTGLAYDSLVTFQQSSGAGGLRLVPDLALSIPAATAGGRTYAFRLRLGIRYSDGQPLRASDFRRGIERLFRVGSPGASLYAGIAGAASCAQHPASCDLARGIVTDDATGTVTFHLTGPDPEFLFKLTEFAFSAPVPPGTPDHETGSRTVPGTGPYEIASVSGTEVRFVRNPFFREWSHAAQPAGNPDSIVWRTVPTAQAAVTAIERGRADWMFGLIPAAQYRQLLLRDPAQLHSSPEFAVEFAPLNTHRAPFNDVRVRQALNYAINRREIVRLYGGPSFATPTCQPIAPGLPGYRRYCPYTLHPSPDGAWGAPDMARARQLVAQSGTLGERVDVWGSPDEGFVPPTAPAYIAGVLRALGYRVHLHLVPIATITKALWKRVQISVEGDWVADYPDPSSYIPQFFACGGGNSNGYYCNPALDREMTEASLLEFSHPGKAAVTWTSIDRQLTDDAVWVPTVSEREVDFVSRRLHNYEYNPVWGFLADQSWLGAPARTNHRRQ
jgi:YVTN family beta-propeller protein